MQSDDVILSFDTSAAHCAAALLSGGTILASRHEVMAKGQAERLFPLLRELLDEAGADWSRLTALGVGVGPGNFTGLRIAVSAARGLALSLRIPVHGVSTFAAQVDGLPRPILSMLPAPRDRVYMQRLDEADEPPMIVDAGEAQAQSAATRTVGAPFGAEPPRPLAESIARIAASRGASGTEPERPVPLYIRPADAAPAREAAPTLLQ